MFVSIVMAVYNGEEFLDDAINGILAQTYPNFEAIIVNDGSTDRTKNILDKVKDSRVRTIHLKKNNGAANALNVGIDHAKGDWIAIHDADDISYPNRIEEQVKHIKKNDELVAVGSFIECIDKKNRKRTRTLGRNAFHRHDEIKKKMFTGCPLTHGSVMFSKDAFYKAGKYNNRFKIAYDYELWCRLITIGEIENVPKVLYQYRIYEDSLSHKNARLTSIELFEIFSKFLRAIKFSYKNRPPSFILVGTEEGCQTFISQSKESLTIRKVILIDNHYAIASIQRSLKRKKVDGIIVLGKKKDKEPLLQQLESIGCERFHYLFDFWSGI